MLKRTAKSALRMLAKRLPWSGRRVVLDTLLDEFGRYEIFQELGARLGVESVSIRGSNGLVYGTISDTGLLPQYATHGAWARDTVFVFRQLFEASGGGTFLDIGASIGLTLIPIARNPMVQCYGFEPEPRNFAYLKQNVAVNCPHSNVSVTQLALFDRAGEVKLELSPINSGDNRIRTTEGTDPAVESAWDTVWVPADRLDRVVRPETLKAPLAIKIDAQGAEPNVVAGGRRVLETAELLSLEFAPSQMRRIGGDVQAELGFLGATFREGSIAPGDREVSPRWRPIEAVVEDLAHHLMDPDIGERYFDVMVRK